MIKTQMLSNLQNEQTIAIILAVQLLWFLLLSIFLIKYINHYRHLVGRNKKLDLKNLLEKILAKITHQEEDVKTIVKRCDIIEKENFKNLQKIGFLRFNPFSDTGGDQSFVLSLLDGDDNGIILSSLHSRGTTRIYAKSIRRGEGHNFKLSKEEKEAIDKAKKRRF